MSRPHTSIQSRLVISLTTAIIALFGISTVGLYFFMRNAFYEQADKNLIRVAEDFMHETARTPDGGLECEFHELNIGEFQKGNYEGQAYYELRDHQGKPLIQSASLTGGEDLPHHPVAVGTFKTEALMLNGEIPGRVIYTSFLLKLEERVHEKREETSTPATLTPTEKAFADSYDENDPQNRVYLAIAEAPTELLRTLIILDSTLLVTGIILAITTFLLVRKIVLSTFRPLIEIAQITEQMGPDNLNTPLPEEQVPLELLPLITRFNQFIKRLDEAISRERRFSIDLAHEIRSPVAEIRSLMEVAADSVGNAHAEDPFNTYQRGAEISKRMSKIIEVITVIHQDNTEAIQFVSESSSIESILEHSIEALDSPTQTRIQFEKNEPKFKNIETDSDLLRAVIDNLLMNAAAHSPAHSKILISSQANGFTIKNTTTDLKESDLSLLTKAFWQKDSARTEADCFGLGLTLVTVYLRLLRGRIDHSLKDGELTTKVLLPSKHNTDDSSLES
ncbi:MAG: hypothetical protein GXP30_08160 [Verrucomicrobia bacterium]|nr:hypothetical protein [Verrucomicrobiota bacterium]